METDEVDALRAAIVRECAVEFGALGWESTGTDMLPAFSRPGSTEIVHELSIGCRVVRTGPVGAAVVRGISLGATVGVRHVEVCQLLGQLTGESPAGQAVDSRGRLMPMFHYALRDAPRGPVPHDWRDSWIRTPDGAAPVVATLRPDLLTYGMPFLAGYTTLADVIGYLEQQTTRGPYRLRALAIAQALSGRLDDALDTLAQFADWAAVTARQAGAADTDPFYYRPSLIRFVAHFNIDPARLPPQIARVL